MALFDAEQRAQAEKAAELVVTNPFHPDWMRLQRDLLGSQAADLEDVYTWHPGWGLWGPRTVYPDVVRLGEQIAGLADQGCRRLREGAPTDDRECAVYRTLALYRLYRDHGEALDRYVEARVQAKGARKPGGHHAERNLAATWRSFRANHKRLIGVLGGRSGEMTPEHLFACFFTLRRAFYHIFFNVVGRSPAVTRLRGATWQSIVTHDLRAWGAGLFDRMKDTPTLVTGPSGTGKELVAQAIGRSLYVEFDSTKEAFTTDFLEAFCPVNLSALSPQLIESELFGHVAGAFTGAVKERVGRLGECPEAAVFLDEIGELNGELQVKLLRVLQEGQFQRVGSNETQEFRGKVIAATNRDLGREIDAGRFREDLYYRLCADRIVTPSLREQLAERPDDLPLMVTHICRRVVGGEQADPLSAQVVDWVVRNLGHGYAWPGNFRELEQCVRSYVIRKEYLPLRRADPTESACAALADEVAGGRRSYADVERRIFALVHQRAGNWQEAGRLLDERDWRTVKARVTGDGAKKPRRRRGANG